MTPPASAPTPSPAADAPAAVAVPAPVRPPADSRRSATSLIDEAAHRLRLAPLGTLGVYYLGTLPFLLALLYFWADMSRSADAAARSVGGSLTLAALFLGMKTAQAVFAARLRAQFARQPMPRWTPARLGRVLLVQTGLHAPGLFVLQIAAGLIFPIGWVYAFYQNVTALGDGSPGLTAREVARRAWRQALVQSKANHVGLSILSGLGFFVWLNLMVAVVVLPQLVRMFTGEENVFTDDISSLVFNTTLWAVSAALVYLVLDPLIKAFYALRCFYEDSARTGEDLLSELRALPPVTPAVDAPASTEAAAAPVAAPRAVLAGAGLLAALLWVVPTAAGSAMPPGATPAPVIVVEAKGSVSPPALDRSIREVLGRREFTWRSPRPPTPPENAKAGPVRRFFESGIAWVRQHVRDAYRSASGFLAKIRRWLHRDEPAAAREEESTGNPGSLLEPLLYLGGALLAALVLYLVWTLWRGRRKDGVARARALEPGPGKAQPPDLSAEDLLATQLPEDEWLALARRLLETGERRLALRAMYLSLLAGLGARGLVVVARHKSNRDYLAELRRRTRDRPELPGAFGRSMGCFERVWYGSDPADDGLLAAFEADREKALG